VLFDEVAKVLQLPEKGLGLVTSTWLGDNLAEGLGVSFGDSKRHQNELHATSARTPTASRPSFKLSEGVLRVMGKYR
jgi:hypothetical protein